MLAVKWIKPDNRVPAIKGKRREEGKHTCSGCSKLCFWSHESVRDFAILYDDENSGDAESHLGSVQSDNEYDVSKGKDPLQEKIR